METETDIKKIKKELRILKDRIKILKTQYKGFDNYTLFMKILRGK